MTSKLRISHPQNTWVSYLVTVLTLTLYGSGPYFLNFPIWHFNQLIHLLLFCKFGFQFKQSFIWIYHKTFARLPSKVDRHRGPRLHQSLNFAPLSVLFTSQTKNQTLLKQRIKFVWSCLFDVGKFVASTKYTLMLIFCEKYGITTFYMKSVRLYGISPYPFQFPAAAAILHWYSVTKLSLSQLITSIQRLLLTFNV